MKKSVYLLWILMTETVGLLSALFSRQGMMRYQEAVAKPALTPPAILFPIVWTVLYGLMGIGAARISMAPDSRKKKQGLNLFIVQLVVNFFWSLLFFNAQVYGFSLLWLVLLWALAVGMTAAFWQVDRTSALLQIPYLLWLSFAAYLNYGVWLLNR